MVDQNKVKDGYKNTDIGIIPNDWSIEQLDKICDVIDPHPSHRAPIIDSSGIPFVGIGDLNENGEIISKKLRLVPIEIYAEHQARYNLSENLIGLGRVASIGKVIKLKENVEPYTISPTLGIIRPKKIDFEYLFQILKSKYIQNQFLRIMSGSTRSSVGMIVLRELKIPLPPSRTEQMEIAKVLSDTDSKIEYLEMQLIKYKQIKIGMMQDLLTGKKRLV